MTDDARPMFGFPVADWHCVFAWLPVDTYDKGIVWLWFVERRRIHRHSSLDGGPLRWWLAKKYGIAASGAHRILANKIWIEGQLSPPPY